MSGPTSNPDWNGQSSAYGTFPRSYLEVIRDEDHLSADDAHSNGGDVSPRRRPSPSRKSSGHVEFRKYLKRPHLSESQRTLSDALRAAKSREEQETLLPDDDHAGSDGCFSAAGHHVEIRDVFAPYPYTNLQIYYNIHRYVQSSSLT